MGPEATAWQTKKGLTVHVPACAKAALKTSMALVNGYLKITFKGDEFFGLGAGKMKYRFDTGKSPRERHSLFGDGPQKGQSIPTIYSLKKDELKPCMPLAPGIARPTEFKTAAGSNLLLLVLHRAPKDGAAVRRPDDLANVKRPWHRPDAPPDGHHKLVWVDLRAEWTQCIIKLEKRDGNQTRQLVSR